jgi:tetratricopeptide (TPR) repeat protein
MARGTSDKIMGITVLLLAAAGCGSKQLKTAPQYEAAYHDQARVPQSNYMQHNDQSIQPQSSADYHYTLGESNSLDGRTQEAIDEFKAALVYDPSSLSLRIRLAGEYVKAGRVEQAVILLDDVKAKDPANTEARMLLGGIYGSIKNYPEALAEYESVLQKEPKHFEAHLYMGAVHAEQKLYA